MSTVDMSGRVGVVTAAAAGIGRESARAFARHGATVVVSDISEERGQETVDLIRNDGGTAEFVRTDVTDEGEVERMVRFAVERFGSLDFAHNNAGGLYGMTGFPTVAETDAGEWGKVVALNLTSAFLCLKHEILAMTGGGAIVNTASAASYRASRAPAVYVTSKHGLIGLTKRAALETARQGIRINAVCPGTVGTDAVVELLGDAEIKRRAETIPMGRLITPAEIAEAAVWLCSDAAAGITGTALAVDGGLIAE